MKKYSHEMLGGGRGHKTCQDKHDFILTSPAKYYACPVAGHLIVILSDPPRHFCHPYVITPSFQLARSSYEASQSEHGL